MMKSLLAIALLSVSTLAVAHGSAEHGSVELTDAHAANRVCFRPLEAVGVDHGARPGSLTVPIGLGNFLQHPVIQRAAGGDGRYLDDLARPCLDDAQ